MSCPGPGKRERRACISSHSRTSAGKRDHCVLSPRNRRTRRARLVDMAMRVPPQFGMRADLAEARTMRSVVSSRTTSSDRPEKKNLSPGERVEIGRASCRERWGQSVYISVFAVSLKQKKHKRQEYIIGISNKYQSI